MVEEGCNSFIHGLLEGRQERCKDVRMKKPEANRSLTITGRSGGRSVGRSVGRSAGNDDRVPLTLPGFDRAVTPEAASARAADADAEAPAGSTG